MGLIFHLSYIIYQHIHLCDKEQTNLQKLKSDRRTPGDQTVDENNYIIDKTLGIVIY